MDDSTYGQLGTWTTKLHLYGKSSKGFTQTKHDTLLRYVEVIPHTLLHMSHFLH